MSWCAPWSWPHGRRHLAVALLTAAAAATLAPCDHPQSPAGTDAAFHGAFDGGTLEFRLEDAGGASRLRLVASNLHYDPTTETLRAEVALGNPTGMPVVGPAGVTVSDFDPPSVQPANAACTECVGCNRACVFDHSGSYGDDGILAAGETSEPRTWVFHDPGAQSFAFRARIPGDPLPPAGRISGIVFLDHDFDGHRDPAEPGMPGRPVQLVHDDQVRTAQSDERGVFAFTVDAPGLYVVELVPTDFCVETTPPRAQVFIVRRPDGSLSSYDGVIFGCRGDGPPPDSSVAVRGVVFIDVDRNGVRDPGEAGLAGVLVVGSVPQCPTFAAIEARTDDRGAYAMRLPGCPPPYLVHRERLVGYVDTTPNPLVFGSPAPELVADFGIAPSDSSGESFVEGVAYDDRDGDGQRDRGEPGLADVEVTVGGYLCLSPVVAIVYTDADGRYRVRGADVHCALPWVVRRGALPDGCDTSPNPIVLRGAPGDPPVVFHVDFGSGPCPPAVTARGADARHR
jgi:hypothetical protein